MKITRSILPLKDNCSSGITSARPSTRFASFRHLVPRKFISMQAAESKEGKPDKKDQRKPKDNIQELIDKEEYLLKKRLPPRLPRRHSDVYVSRKTNFNAQLRRCEKILSSEKEVFIHGLGTAINKAINLALQLKERGLDTVEVATHTSTVELVDDLEPETDDLEPETRTRQNSAVHIRVYRLESETTERETK